MVAAIGKGQIRMPPVQYAEVGVFFLDDAISALQPNLIGAWFFNQFSGETDEEAAFRCSQNWAPGASNQAADRSYTNGIPTTIAADYFRFENNSPLVTRLTLPASSTMVTIARTMDTTIGNSANDRGFICGTFGNAANEGDAIQFQNATTGQFGVIASEVTGASAVTTVALTGTNDLDEWRMWAGTISATTAFAENLNPADGSTPTASTVLTGGHLPGSQTFTIGGRVTSGANYNNNHKDIACILLFDTDLSAGQLNSVQAQLERTMAMTGLTFGSV